MMPRNETQNSARLRELVQETGLPLRRLPEILEEKPQECLAWWSEIENKIKIAPAHFSRMSKLTGIPENQLVDGIYDKDLARKRLFGDFSSLPERYASNQNSFLRTSTHIMRYVRLTRGQLFADQVLTELQLSPLIYDYGDTKINLTYFADLLEILSNKGFRSSELDNIASVIFLSLNNTALGQKFENSQTMFEVYETLANNFNYFDSNFEYKSEFINDKYVLTTLLPVDQHLELKNNPEKIERLMRYRHILLAWFPYLAGLNPLFPKAEVLRSSKGILETRYEFSLAESKRPSLLHGL